MEGARLERPTSDPKLNIEDTGELAGRSSDLAIEGGAVLGGGGPITCFACFFPFRTEVGGRFGGMSGGADKDLVREICSNSFVPGISLSQRANLALDLSLNREPSGRIGLGCCICTGVPEERRGGGRGGIAHIRFARGSSLSLSLSLERTSSSLLLRRSGDGPMSAEEAIVML